VEGLAAVRLYNMDQTLAGERNGILQAYAPTGQELNIVYSSIMHAKYVQREKQSDKSKRPA
jgi:hypothetical protein